MIKKIAVAICMCAALGAHAQKIELGIAGGIKANSGYTGSLAGYVSFGKLQAGAVAEVSTIDYSRKGRPGPAYTVFNPGANLNFIIPFPRGYAYPGLRYRYITHLQEDVAGPIRGHEAGVHGGVVIKIFKSLSANAELGAAFQNTKTESPGPVTFTNINAQPILIEPQISQLVFPVMIGLRWAF